MIDAPRARITLAWIAVFAATSLAVACASKSPAAPPQQKIVKELRAMNDAVPKAVADPKRAEQVQTAIGRMEAELVEFRTVFDTFETDLRSLNSRRDTTRAQLAERLDRFDADRKAARTRVLDLHVAMTAATTADEWKQLSRYEREALVASGR